jgi:uncharacterized delta-60 repeat protein
MVTTNRLIRVLKITCVSITALLIAACGGGGGSTGGGEPRYDYPSALDTSFGVAGYRVFSTGLSSRAYLGAFVPTNFTVDSYGRIVIVGNRTSTDREAWLLRLNADGTPDTACGTGGWISWSTGGPANPYKVRVMPDGRYAVGGVLGTASIWMVKADCTFDTSWGNAGKAAMPSPTATEVTGAINDFDVGADGSIVATVASTLSGKLLVARLLPSGAIDTAFGASGYTSVAPADHGSPRPGAIRIRPGGKIIVAASFAYSSQVGQLPGFAQFTSTGQLDTSFGDGGFQIQNPGSNLVGLPKDMVLLPDGSAVQSGLTQPGVITGTVIGVDTYWMKVSLAGVPDTSVGANGIKIWTAGPADRNQSTNYATSLARTSSGQILTCQNWTNNTEAASTQVQAAPLQVLVSLSDSNGGLIGSFGSGGTASLPRSSGFAETCVGLVKAADGRILALLDYGPASNATGETMAVVRISP